MSKVGAPEQKGEGFPAVLQPGPVHWALIRALFLAQLQKLPLARFVSAHQSIGACSLLLQVPALFGFPESGF